MARQTRLVVTTLSITLEEGVFDITARSTPHKTGTTEQAVKIGDVVQIHEDTLGSQWKLGVIEELVKGNNQYVRSVTVRTASGRTNHPIARLYPLEVEHSSSMESPQQEPESTVEPSDSRTSHRHPRRAAVRAREQLKEWTDILRHPPEDVENDD